MLALFSIRPLLASQPASLLADRLLSALCCCRIRGSALCPTRQHLPSCQLSLPLSLPRFRASFALSGAPTSASLSFAHRPLLGAAIVRYVSHLYLSAMYLASLLCVFAYRCRPVCYVYLSPNICYIIDLMSIYILG